MLAYRIDLTPDDNHTVLITAPAFPELTTFAESAEKAVVVAADALEEALAARIADGRDIPTADAVAKNGSDSSVQLSSLTSIKASLYQLMKVQGITRADLQRRLGWHREQVDRLFRLDHASRMDQLEAAARELGHEIHIDLRAAA